MIELNGIQISDNNINTKKNVKIYTDEKQLSNVVNKEVHPLKGALKDLHTPIAISSENTTESKAQNVKNITDFVAKAKAAGIADVNGMAVTCNIDNGDSGVGNLYLLGDGSYLILCIATSDDLYGHYIFRVTSAGEYTENSVVVNNRDDQIASNMLVQGARRPIIFTPDTTEVDEETYQKLLTDDVDVMFKDAFILHLGDIDRSDPEIINLYFTGRNMGVSSADEVLFSSYTVSVTKSSPHNVSSTEETNNLQDILDSSGYLDQSILTSVSLTAITSTNKTQLDSFLSKVPNAQVMHVTYKDVYAGTLHKIGTDWFGQLVKNTNSYEDCICIKLVADGTVTEGTTSLAQVNAKLDNIIG